MEWDIGETSLNSSNVNQQQQQQQQQQPQAQEQQQRQQTKNNKLQTIRPVTIKQVTMATAYEDGSVVFIDEKEISTITFIGVIRSCENSSTGYTYIIEDGTASMQVRQWDTEGVEEAHHVNAFREGMYVRVYGRIRRYDGKTNCLAFALRSITDFNELSFHSMEAMLAHASSRSHNGIQDDRMDSSFTSGVSYEGSSMQFKFSSRHGPF